MFQERWHLGHAGGLPSLSSFGTRSAKTFVSVLAYVVAKSASAAGRGNILRHVSPIITQRRLLSQAEPDCSVKEQHLGVLCKPIRAFDRSWTSGHAGMMRTAILIGTILGLPPAFAQEALSVWRDPDGGCVYFKLGDTLSLRYQRDGSPDCPDARRETSPPSVTTDQERAVTRDDVRDVTRAIEGLSRRLDDVKREFERRGRNPP
jgi:hypothetical protein